MDDCDDFIKDTTIVKSTTSDMCCGKKVIHMNKHLKTKKHLDNMSPFNNPSITQNIQNNVYGNDILPVLRSHQADLSSFGQETRICKKDDDLEQENTVFKSILIEDNERELIRDLVKHHMKIFKNSFKKKNSSHESYDDEDLMSLVTSSNSKDSEIIGNEQEYNDTHKKSILTKTISVKKKIQYLLKSKFKNLSDEEVLYIYNNCYKPECVVCTTLGFGSKGALYDILSYSQENEFKVSPYNLSTSTYKLIKELSQSVDCSIISKLSLFCHFTGMCGNFSFDIMNNRKMATTNDMEYILLKNMIVERNGNQTINQACFNNWIKLNETKKNMDPSPNKNLKRKTAERGPILSYVNNSKKNKVFQSKSIFKESESQENKFFNETENN